MTKPVNLSIVRNRPDQGIVETLELALERAKKGELVEFDICARMSDGYTYSAYSGDYDNPLTMYGIMHDRAESYRERNIPKNED